MLSELQIKQCLLSVTKTMNCKHFFQVVENQFYLRKDLYWLKLRSTSEVTGAYFKFAMSPRDLGISPSLPSLLMNHPLIIAHCLFFNSSYPGFFFFFFPHKVQCPSYLFCICNFISIAIQLFHSTIYNFKAFRESKKHILDTSDHFYYA